MDPLHNLVVSSRLADDANWTMAGFSIPMLFPDASTVPWAAIRDLRREKQLRRFRAVLREVEEEALDEVADGDVEAAIHHAYERHLANAQERISGLGWIGAWGVSNFVIGGGTSAATAPIGGLWAMTAASASSASTGVAIDIRKWRRARHRSGWLSIHQRLGAHA